MSKKLNCCICKDVILPDENGWAEGHNAQPIKDGRCCTSCNEKVVLSERYMMLLSALQERNKQTVKPKKDDRI
jgi:hypothetical protein